MEESTKKNNDGDKSEKKSFGQSVQAVRAEFNKVVWPNRKDLTKMTATVIVVCLLFGAIITAFDSAFGFVIGYLVDLF